jgi:hypothetical protein
MNTEVVQPQATAPTRKQQKLHLQRLFTMLSGAVTLLP